MRLQSNGWGFLIVISALAFSGSTVQAAVKTISSLSSFDKLKCETPDLPPDEIISYCAAMMRMDAPVLVNFGDYHYPQRSNMANYALHTGLAFLREGQNDFARKYFDFAIGVITEKLSPFPNDAGLLGERCWIRAVINAGLEDAFKDCDRATTGKPEDGELHRNKGFVLFRQGKYQDALAELNIAVKLNSRDSYALFLRSMVKQKLGEIGADEDLKAASDLHHKISAVFKNYGVDSK